MIRLWTWLVGWTCHRCGQRRRGGSCGPCLEDIEAYLRRRKQAWERVAELLRKGRGHGQA